MFKTQKLHNLVTMLLGLFFWVAATPQAPKAPASASTLPGAQAQSPALASDAVERGRKVFRMNCLQCHNADPKKAGSQGPAIAGSSLELLSAKVLTGKYPAGYTPQRKTRIMPPLPFLKKDIENIHAFLNAAAK